MNPDIHFQPDQIVAASTERPAEQAWLSSPLWDSIWILSPAFIAVGCVLLFREQMAASTNVPLWVWVCFVLLIDVAHVYATLFRTYLDPTAFQNNKTILLAIPAIAWVCGSLLYSLDAIYFWRALAYLAVFHFIRQQFGFVILYSRKDPLEFKKYRWLDCAAVYLATLYPILFWHTNMPRNFSWFVAGDFIETLPQIVTQAGFAAYLIVAFAYIIKEIVLGAKNRFFNIPKNLLLAGTALSWWIGIVAFNSDMAFTITNVVSHGIPYMALIWLYHHQISNTTYGDSVGKDNRIKLGRLLISNVAIFFVFLAALAYLEEGLWDGLVWREHLSLFAPFSFLPSIGDTAILALLIPLLSLPQSTHYLLDGFIWRVKDRKSDWSA